MNIPVEKKTAMLKEFHKHLYDEEWQFMESTEKDKAVLEEFPTVSVQFYASRAPQLVSCNYYVCVCVHVSVHVHCTRMI